MEEKIRCSECNKAFKDGSDVFIKRGLPWHIQCWYGHKRKEHNQELNSLWEKYPQVSKTLANILIDNPGVFEDFEKEKYFALLEGENGEEYTEYSNNEKDFFSVLEGDIIYENSSVEEIYIDKKPIKFDYKVVFKLKGETDVQ